METDMLGETEVEIGPFAVPQGLMVPMFFHRHFDFDRTTGSCNNDLVDHLKACGSLKDSKLEGAFRAVDRAKFLPTTALGSDVYDDAPLRIGNFHMSQPSLYADALSSLDLQPGLSFLNVGAGTGYLSSIVSEVLGPGIHHGVDVNQEVMDHAKQTFKQQGKDHISYFCVNALDLELSLCPRYDRIYIGACMNEGSKNLLGLLQVGGVLVGPFETPSGQFIRRVLRTSEEKFEASNLKSVSFGRLVPSESMTGNLFALPAAPWTPETHAQHSPGFRAALRAVLLCTTRASSPAHILPREIFVKHIFGYVHPRWFSGPTVVPEEILDESADMDIDEDEATRRLVQQLVELRNGQIFFAIRQGELFVRATGERDTTMP